MKIYTRKGDDGSTGLFYGGRVAKDETGPEAYGTVDEATSAIGVARAKASDGLAVALLEIQREMFVVGAELATGTENRSKLEPGVSRVTQEMVEGLESRIDEVVEAVGMPTEFVVPGGNPLAAALDRSALHQIEIEVAVAVVVEQTDSGAHDLGEVEATRRTVPVLEVDADLARHFVEPSRALRGQPVRSRDQQQQRKAGRDELQRC